MGHDPSSVPNDLLSWKCRQRSIITRNSWKSQVNGDVRQWSLLITPEADKSQECMVRFQIWRATTESNSDSFSLVNQTASIEITGNTTSVQDSMPIDKGDMLGIEAEENCFLPYIKVAPASCPSDDYIFYRSVSGNVDIGEKVTMQQLQICDKFILHALLKIATGGKYNVFVNKEHCSEVNNKGQPCRITL